MADEIQNSDVKAVILIIAALLLPPLAVFLKAGNITTGHFLISIVLTIFVFLPGVIHALWYCFAK